MIFNMDSGGSAGLNFKIVGGTTQPSSASENTIWVNTSTAITSWAFSATQPTAATGKIWIVTGAYSQTGFNALKKNEMQIYPLKAYQYDGSAWVEKTAKIYQSGTWNDWVVYLYDAGNQYTDLTGGWVARGNNSNNDTFGVGKITFNTGSMTISNSGNHSFVYASTQLPINLTNYNKITVVCTAESAPDGTILGVFPTDCSWVGGNINGTTHVDVSAGTYTLNIGDISGEYYIAIRSGCSGTGESFSVTITEVSIE